MIEQIVPKAGDCLLDRYVLNRELGRGGFGIVFHATHLGLDEAVAVKILLPHVVVIPKLRERFQREVRVAKGLRHPNTIRIIDFAETESGLPFYVMEFIRGESLDRVLFNECGVSPARAKRIGEQLLKSLAEAHANGVVHRDLKPANMLLCEIFGERDFIKVLDFGIAKALLDTEGRPKLTETDSVMGTPHYMSPEQASGRNDIDRRSDIYSVGLILAECLTGEAVVDGEAILAILTAHASSTPLPFSDEVMASPLFPVIKKATEKDRSLRYQNASEMLTQLLALGSLPDSKGTPKMWGRTLDGTLRPILASKLGLRSEKALQADRDLDVAPTLAKPRDEEQGRSSVLPPPPIGVDTILDANNANEPVGSSKVAKEPDGGLVLVDVDETADTDEITAIFERKKPTTPVILGAPSKLVKILLLLAVLGLGLLAFILSGMESTKTGGKPLMEPSVEAPEAIEPTQADPVAVEEDGGPAILALTMTTVAVATERVRSSVPSTHQIRFEGTEQVEVFYGETLLGTTPFVGLFPNTDTFLALRFERSGYRTVAQDVRLTDSSVPVRLRRRRTTSNAENFNSTDNSGSNDDSGQEAEPASVFGNAPADDSHSTERTP